MRKVIRIAFALAAVALLAVGGRSLLLRSADFPREFDPVPFWSKRRVALNDFVADFRAYGRIRSMSDGQRHWKQLNDEAYESPAPIRRGIGRFADVMQRDSIDPRMYQNFRKRLTHLELIEVETTDRYTAFIYDGFLDNLVGFVWVAPGQPEPRVGEWMLSNTQVVSVTRLDSHWYYVVTT
jgi:hypothetical protein